MKKALTILLALSMLLALCACGGSEEAAFTRGTVTGSRYESSFLGLACELDDSWHIYTDEELAQLMGQTVEIFNDSEKYQKMLESTDVIQDFNAVHETGASVNIVYQKLSGATRLLDAESYQDLAVTMLETTYTDAGLSGVSVEKNSFELVGVSHPGTYSTGSMSGLGFYSQQVYIKSGSYIAIITFSSFHEEDIDVMAGFFSALS